MMKSILLLLVLAIVQQQSVVQADISFTRSASTGTGRRMLRSRSAAVAAAEPATPVMRQLSDEGEPEDDYEPDVFLGTGCEQTNEGGDEDGEEDCEELVPVFCQTEEEQGDPVGTIFVGLFRTGSEE
mmetsp:Transcript_52581/g.127355  ORF Transcript_52581/g.127355 Transcript_52581/m.127355 type:complete len:127 (+) Transcript_52581:95-475(+)